MQVHEAFTEYGLTTEIGYYDTNKTVIVISFTGVLDMLSAEVVFVKRRATLKEWFENKPDTQRIVFDLFHLDHINSFAIGHLTQFYLALYKRKIPVTLVIDPESTVYQILDYCGLFELHGLHVQRKDLTEGLEPLGG
ncbi:MAG: STAS domain-containing protein [Gemmatimonadetes bacterium]|nr:MAG: STAS domain-containing protein [Gemmatimonadota bacterium]